jgi:hypothetical protein
LQPIACGSAGSYLGKEPSESIDFDAHGVLAFGWSKAVLDVETYEQTATVVG